MTTRRLANAKDKRRRKTRRARWRSCVGRPSDLVSSRHGVSRNRGHLLNAKDVENESNLFLRDHDGRDFSRIGLRLVTENGSPDRVWLSASLCQQHMHRERKRQLCILLPPEQPASHSIPSFCDAVVLLSSALYAVPSPVLAVYAVPSCLPLSISHSKDNTSRRGPDRHGGVTWCSFLTSRLWRSVISECIDVFLRCM